MFELLAAINGGIAAAYVVIGAWIIPQLRLRHWATLSGAAFFITCALTHVELAIHGLVFRPEWMVDAHMWVVHVAQLVVDWAFIVAMAPWRRAAPSALARKIEDFLARRGAPLTDRERHFVDALVRAGSAQDVTVEELHAAVEALAEHKEVERQKDDFIAFASHELRTPAAVMYGAAATLLHRDDDLAPEQRKQLIAALAENGERLNRLIDQVLDISQHQTGKAIVTPQALRLRDVVARVVGDDGVELDIPSDLVARADEQALERVIGNLVANARRYGADPITVSAYRDNGHVVVAVEDRGDGIPAEFVPVLFSRFTRSKESSAGQPPGSGLGLAIAAAYAKAQGAELRYQPAEPHGARFELTLGVADDGSSVRDEL